MRDTAVDRDDNECPQRATVATPGSAIRSAAARPSTSAARAIAKSAQKLAADEAQGAAGVHAPGIHLRADEARRYRVPAEGAEELRQGLAKLGAVRAKVVTAVRATCGEPELSLRRSDQRYRPWVRP